MLNQTQGNLTTILEAKSGEKLEAMHASHALRKIDSYVVWYRDRHWCTMAIGGWIIKLKQHQLVETRLAGASMRS